MIKMINIIMREDRKCHSYTCKIIYTSRDAKYKERRKSRRIRHFIYCPFDDNSRQFSRKKTHVSADAFAIQMQRESEYVKDGRSGGYYVFPDENYR